MKITVPTITRHFKTAFRTEQPAQLAATLNLIGFERRRPDAHGEFFVSTKHWAEWRGTASVTNICRLYRNWGYEAPKCFIRVTWDGRALPGGDDTRPAIAALELLVAATDGEVQ